MREIRFRAWTGLNILYEYDEDPNFNTKDGFGSLRYRSISALQGDSNDYIWMQFTGLKDKNGKRIYEGDIVDGIDGDRPFTDIVEWSEEDGAWTTRSGEGKTLSMAWLGALLEDHDTTIIGNIYENPELLENNLGPKRVLRGLRSKNVK